MGLTGTGREVALDVAGGEVLEEEADLRAR